MREGRLYDEIGVLARSGGDGGWKKEGGVESGVRVREGERERDMIVVVYYITYYTTWLLGQVRAQDQKKDLMVGV